MANVTWQLDPVHSEIQFKVKHLMISYITGYFKQFTVLLKSDPDDDFSNAQVEFLTNLDSLDTNHAPRDQHLKSADFFDVANHPQIKFENGQLKKNGSKEYALDGLLTIRSVTKPVTFAVEFGGITPDPWGNIRAGFTISGKINRQDFGMQFNQVTEIGNKVLSDEVFINCNIQFIRKR